jgi:hypothetical protein
LRYLSRDNRASSANGVRMRLNGDTGNTYSWHYLIGGGTSASAGAAASNDAFYIGEQPSANAALGSVFAGGIVDILDYKSTSKNKTIKVLEGFDMNGSGAAEYWSGAWYNSSTAVNSITIFFDGSASAIQYSSFALYGIKGE